MDHTYFHVLLISFALSTAIYLFQSIVRRKYAILAQMNNVPDPVADHGRRIKEVLTVFLGQKKLFQEFRPGFMHAIIFWGFLILLLRAAYCALRINGAVRAFQTSLSGESNSPLFGLRPTMISSASFIISMVSCPASEIAGPG